MGNHNGRGKHCVALDFSTGTRCIESGNWYEDRDGVVRPELSTCRRHEPASRLLVSFEDGGKTEPAPFGVTRHSQPIFLFDKKAKDHKGPRIGLDRHGYRRLETTPEPIDAPRPKDGLDWLREAGERAAKELDGQ